MCEALSHPFGDSPTPRSLTSPPTTFSLLEHVRAVTKAYRLSYAAEGSFARFWILNASHLEP